MLDALAILIFSVGVLNFFYKDYNIFWSFFFSSLTAILVSGLFRLFSRGDKEEVLSTNDAVIIVFFIWTLSIILSALPFVYSGYLNMHQAVFESTSGWTTTGLSMFTDVEVLPKTFLIWRSIIQFIGGAGFALIMVIVAGSMGVGLYQAEGRTDNVVPNLRDSAKIIIGIYISLAVAGIILIKIFTNISLFDAFNHTLTALATGGFSTKNTSVAYFNDPVLEYIIIILMVLGGTGFGVHYAFGQMIKNTLRNIKEYLSKEINYLELKERIKSEPFLKNPEPKTMFFIAVISITMLLFFTTLNLYTGFGNSFRIAVFQGISALTGTGFATVTFNLWNNLGMLVMTLLMITGGMMDSTSGGLKLFRIYVILKTVKLNILNFFKPAGTKFHIEVYKGVSKKKINENTFREIISVVTMYFFIYFVGVFVLLGYGYNLKDSLFEYASALSAVGLSTGITAPDAPLGVIWIETLGMYLGRLEFFAIFYAIIKLFKDIKEFLK